MSTSARPRFQPLIHRGYHREFTKLTKRAERAPELRRVLEQVLSIHGALERGDVPGVPTTKHGETRIKHVVKYDLASAYRLVTWVHGGVVVPLFVGSHEETDRWLDTYRGATFVYRSDERGAMVEFRVGAMRSDTVDQMGAAADADPSPTEAPAPLSMLDDSCFDGLVDSKQDLRELKEGLRVDMDAHVRRRFLRGFFGDDGSRIDHVLAAFEHARCGQLDSARMDLWQAAGRAKAAEDDVEGFIRALAGMRRGTQLSELNKTYLSQARQLVQGGSAEDWMLWLVPSQQKIVDAKLGGPARLLGVSGSGKTAVLLHRAVALARRYPGEKILVVTLNESLARYLSHLVDRLCPETELRERIDVRPLASVFAQIARLLPGIHPRRIDPRSGETPAMSWADFSEKHMEVLRPIAEAIEADDRAAGCDALQYLREELVWIRSGWGLDERSSYDEAAREGRAIPFPRVAKDAPTPEARGGLPPDTRPTLRAMLREFEEYMMVGQVFDIDGVSVLAHSAIRRFPQEARPERYRCVLVDEYQDVSTVELEILNWMVADPSDGLFVCGDLAQKVFPKHHNNVLAKVSFQGRGFKLEENFRNTREILAAAHALVERFKGDAAVERGTILDPDFAVRSGPKPHLVECATRAQQIDYVCAMVRDLYSDPQERSQTCVVSHDDATLVELSARLEGEKIPAIRLSPQATFSTSHHAVRICHLEDIKGFEFKTVFVLDASDPKRKRSTGIGGDVLREGLPTAGVPWGERWRDAFRLYVAMSRARESLFVCYVFNRSPLLGGLGDLVTEERAIDWIEAPQAAAAGVAIAGMEQPPPAEASEFGDPLVWGFQQAFESADGRSFGPCRFPDLDTDEGFRKGCRCTRCLQPKSTGNKAPDIASDAASNGIDLTERYKGWGLGYGGQ
jgi:superfamily I DNA/RNA helicase